MEAMKALLAAGAEVNHASNTGKTALYWAALEGHVEAIQALVTAGADVNHVNNAGNAPLYWAAQKGHVEAIQWRC